MLVGEAEYAAIIESIASGKPRADVLAAIVRWKLEPVDVRLARFADQAVRIAKRLGKDVAVIAEGNDVRLCAQAWAPIWSSLVHVIRNGLDHGIESPEERVAAGKPAQARLWLRARENGNRVVVEIADDGRGISWDRLAAKAKAAGLPSTTRADLVEAIFADGVSTKEVTSDLSGRGVGMAAVRMACRELGGDIEIESAPSKGTIVRCVFPNGVKPEESVAELLTLKCVPTLVPLKRAS
jgi:two-component system chemotaxis sensor kinase CheA